MAKKAKKAAKARAGAGRRKPKRSKPKRAAAKRAAPKRKRLPDLADAPLPLGLQHTHERKKRRSDAPRSTKAFLPGETGQPDATPVADAGNPLGVQGGRGPLNQEGEGDRQNDQLAELEQIEPDLDKEK